jgi:hypothetical protein
MTPQRLQPHLEGWLKVARPGTNFLVHLDGEWIGSEQLRVGQEILDVRVCQSELAVREQLVRERPDGKHLLLLTHADIRSQDLLARVSGRRVRRLDAWEAVQRLFGVQRIDPVLTKHKWMAEALVESAPITGYAKSASQVLDADRAWRDLLSHRYGIKEVQGLEGLLTWSGGGEKDRLTASPEVEYSAVHRRLVDRVEGAAPVLAAVTAGRGSETLAIGLVLRALLDGAAGEARAAARALLGSVVLTGWAFDDRAARAYAAEAETRLLVMLTDDPQRAYGVLRQAEVLVGSLNAEPLVIVSDVLDSGLRARLAALGDALSRRGREGGVARVAAAADLVRQHRVADHHTVAEMTVRLVRWLAAPEVPAADLHGAAIAHAGDSSYADWARVALRVVTGNDTLDTQLRALIADADARRREEEGRFGELLAAYVGHSAAGAAIVGVEEILNRVLAPLATLTPILLIVLDGLSHRVACELMEDVTSRGWTELRPDGQAERTLVLSTLPSVTTFSRMSLLSGTLAKGVAADEKKAFAAHPGLRAASGRNSQPLLFHKGGISDPHGGLSEQLRAEIAGERRIVAAVVNAIDDHLARDNQLSAPWDTSYIPLLRRLLDEARDAGRLVVIASDHGHVLDHGAGKQRTGSPNAGERWRDAARQPEDGEIVVGGVRVLAPGGSCVVAVDERIRYSPPKHGYHGGATAQEVLAPLLVLTAGLSEAVPGWSEARYDLPVWWVESAPAVAAAPSAAPPSPGPSAETTTGQLTLGTPAPEIADSPLTSLASSAAFRVAREAATKARVPVERFDAILSALAAAQGRLLLDALARQTGIIPGRLRGTLATMRLYLNVEGYDVLSVDEDTGDVRLDLALLRQQFEIDD